MRGWLVTMMLAIAAPATAQGNDDALVASAGELLSGGRYVEALAVAQDAVRAAPRDYRAHYYVAMAQMQLKQFDAAAAEAKTAFDAAAVEARPQVQKLIDAIAQTGRGTGAHEAADAALARGLTAKAANLYAGAWQAGRKDADAAFAAAGLYRERLDRVTDAALLLREVQTSLPGTAAATRALAQLDEMRPQLRAIVAEQIRLAKLYTVPASAFDALALAERIEPDNIEVRRTQVSVAARQGDPAKLLAPLGWLSAHRSLGVDDMAHLGNLPYWIAEPPLRAFVTDAFGEQARDSLDAVARRQVDAARADLTPQLAARLRTVLPAGAQLGAVRLVLLHSASWSALSPNGWRICARYRLAGATSDEERSFGAFGFSAAPEPDRIYEVDGRRVSFWEAYCDGPASFPAPELGGS